MSDPLDAVLVNARRDRSGRPVVAALRRHDEDHWDWLAVGQDGQPLAFWATGLTIDSQGLIRGNDGSVLSVLSFAPPGVEPAGSIVVPADKWKSPLMKWVFIVGKEGDTEVSSPNYSAGPPPPPGPRMLESLFEQFTYRERDQFMLLEVDASDGKRAKVLLDLNKRPLLFWLTMPGEEQGKYELFTAVAASNGIAAVAVDELLRPIQVFEG
jgi:hypothetical protein